MGTVTPSQGPSDPGAAASLPWADRLARAWHGASVWERRTAASGAVWLLGYTLAVWVVRRSTTGQLLLGDLVYLAPIAAAAALSVAVVARGRGDRLVWSVLAAAMLLWLAGDVAWAAASVPNAGEVPFPGPPDVFYVGFFTAYVVVAVLAFRDATPLRQFRGLLDALIIAVSVVHLTWDLLAAPQLSEGLSGASVLAAAYPLLQVSALVVLLSVGSGYRAVPPSTLLIAVSLLVGTSTNLAWTYLMLAERYASGAWLDIGWQVEAVLVCLAAVRVLTRTEPPARARASSADHALMPTLVATLATVAVLLRDLQQGQVRWSALALVCLVMLGLTLRLWLTLRDRAQVTERLDEALQTSQRLAVTDPLTGLYNRRFLEEVLHLQAQRRRPELGVLVLDLDHFKTINDTHGHGAGDAVLVEVATRLSRALRDGDVLARYGGEEFAVVLPEADLEIAQEIAERCRRTLADRPVRLPDGREQTVTVSIGAGTLPDSADTVLELLQATDRALYAAKAAGRNAVALATREPADPHTSDHRVPAGLQLLADVAGARYGQDAHAGAVVRWTAVLADALAQPPEVRANAAMAARLRDLGMLAVRDAVLSSTTALSDADRAQVHQHPVLGAEVLAGIPGVAHLAPAVRAHHERWDGAGYPDQLRGSAIPVEARLVAVCDAWAAMRSARPYRRPLSEAAARTELAGGAGSQFDPDVVVAFLDLHTAGLVGQVGEPAPGAPSCAVPAAR